MARQESDREDLLREATALVERIKLFTGEGSEGREVVVGFRRDGAASVYFGADPAYYFNPTSELRRAFCDGLLFKAKNGRLVALRRERTKDEVQLVRRELSNAEQAEFVHRTQGLLADLKSAMDRGDCIVVGRVPADRDVLARVRAWLADRESLKIADSPHAGG